MQRSRRTFSAEFKSKVALESLQERLTLSELAKKYEIHPNQISEWKRQLLAHSASIFSRSSSDATSSDEEHQQRLYAKIGQLEMERDFLKKSLAKSAYLVKGKS